MEELERRALLSITAQQANVSAECATGFQTQGFGTSISQPPNLAPISINSSNSGTDPLLGRPASYTVALASSFPEPTSQSGTIMISGSASSTISYAHFQAADTLELTTTYPAQLTINYDLSTASNSSYSSPTSGIGIETATIDYEIPRGSGTYTVAVPAGAGIIIEAGIAGTTNLQTSAPVTVSAACSFSWSLASQSTTSLSSSLNPSPYGQPVTFTATVAPTAPGLPVPTGTVTFLDGSTSLGTGTLNASGVATFTTSTPLAFGTHSITAVYGGDSNFSGSTSAPVTQIVLAPQLALTSVSTLDSNELTVNYTINANVQSEGVQSVGIAIFRSDKPVYDATDTHNIEVASYNLTGDMLNQNSGQTITINSSSGVWGINADTLLAPLAPDPQLPYVVAVPDPNHSLPAEVTTDDSAAHFRIYAIAAVTQGFGPGNAPWVQPMVASLQADGYDAAFPVYWQSFRPSAGNTQLGGDQMFQQIVATADCLAGLQQNDIIDVQLIGHSRGSAVIDRAMLDLLASERQIPAADQQAQTVIAASGALPLQLEHGYYKLTFLDPHPANSQTVSLVSMQSLATIGLLTDTADLVYLFPLLAYSTVSNVYQDPSLVVPARVNQAEDFYQQNSTSALSAASLKHSPFEAAFNLQGQAPDAIQIVNPKQTLFDTRNLSTLGFGHSEIWLWYQNVVIPLLKSGGTPPPVPSAGSQANITFGSPTQLIILPSPDLTVDSEDNIDPAAGAPFTLYVLAVDSLGNLVTNFNGSVSLALVNNPGQASLAGISTTTAVNGIATFSGLTLGNPGIGYTFQANSLGLIAGASPPLDVYADQLVVTFPPPDPVNTDPPFGLVVTAEDGSGNTDTSFNGDVTVSLNNFQGTSGVLGGITTVAAVDGVATFSGQTLNKTGDDWTVSVNAPGAASTVAGPFDVTAGPAVRLQAVIEPSATITAGSNFTLVVSALDSDGNVDPGFDGTVTLSLTNNPRGGMLSGTLSIPAVDGVATFTGLTINEAGSDYIIQASSNGLSTTSDVAVTTASVATRLVVTTQPVNPVVPGGSIGLVVSAEDAFGAIDSSFTGNVTIDLNNLLGQPVTLAGTVTEAAIGGVATFSGLTVDAPGFGYILQAASTGLSPATTESFNVLPSPTFTNLMASTITYGTASTTISGTLDAHAGDQGVLAGEPVQITLNGVTQSATLDANDSFSAAFDTGGLDVAGSPYIIGFSYAGDGVFSSASGMNVLTVNPATLTIMPQPGQSMVYGSAVQTLTYTATGFVNGTDSSPLIGLLGTTATLASSVGKYDFTLGSLSAGANYILSLSADPPFFVVEPDGTTVTVVSSANPSVYGQTMTLTATVSDTSASFTPVGSVQFLIDGVAVGSPVVLSGSIATFVDSVLSVASHTVTAVYQPASADFATSTGTFFQTINPADATSQVSISKSGLVYNRATQLFGGTVTITNIGTTNLLGTLEFEITGLPAGVVLANATGIAPDGNQYIAINLANGVLAPGQSITFTVLFSDPTKAYITYGFLLFDVNAAYYW